MGKKKVKLVCLRSRWEARESCESCKSCKYASQSAEELGRRAGSFGRSKLLFKLSFNVMNYEFMMGHGATAASANPVGNNNIVRSIGDRGVSAGRPGQLLMVSSVLVVVRWDRRPGKTDTVASNIHGV